MADVVIIMGSKADLPHAEKVAEALRQFDISWEMRVASAHKSPAYLLEMLAGYEARGEPRLYITIAGRSNALSGMVDAAVSVPVIACPPYSERFAGADIFSSLRMPSGVAPALVLEPEGAALLAAKILGRREAVRLYQEEQRRRLIADDQSLR
ncbi:MAG: AIR carboxylase family protein [Anaerolineae bacterium]|nr:AIR carboxylase family protein [Anaerolineae bacterium]